GSLESFALRERFDIQELTVDQDAVVRLAAKTGLSTYDASYLWLSRRHGAELVTLDRRLADAAAASAP
ncbi:MAG: PIN domain-containing protein, partial [Caulobacteraceae bacterium]